MSQEGKEQQFGCHSCNGYYYEDQMASSNKCLECQEQEDDDYENSFRNAFKP